MRVDTLPLSEANKFVVANHRHHGPSVGHRFSLGLWDGDVLRGCAIVGRPVARRIHQDKVVEVNRLCTDGVKNGCSMLYAAAAREARKRGFQLIITYILESEPGTSLKAAGWSQMFFPTAGGSWSCKSRPMTDKHPIAPKRRWSKVL